MSHTESSAENSAETGSKTPAMLAGESAGDQPLRIAPGTLGQRRQESPTARVRFQSRIMQKLLQEAIDYANSSATVLITGESGTGKEVFAQVIHDSSDRAGKRYERVNCAALSESLVESELFGHERGAFTGAVEKRIGRFEWADGGTLLLDEISEISLAIQAKLLRVLEESEFQRIGNNATHRSDVRVIATSNKDLNAQVDAGLFRNDLYYRLNVLRIQLPPLRERREDIPLLAQFFFDHYRHESTIALVGFDSAAMKLLCDYHWPGNVRQLRNFVHRACIVAKQPRITAADFPQLEPESQRAIPAWIANLKLSDLERSLILHHLQRFGGSRTKVAEVMGLTSKTVSNKLKTYAQMGIDIPEAA